MNLPTNQPNINEVRDITNGMLESISHDLRTPLSAILLWIKVLSEQDELQPQELKDGLQAIRDCVDEQLEIIEDIVDSSLIATGRIRLKPERVDLVEALSGMIEDFRQLADEMALELREDFDLALGTVSADSRRLKQLAGSMLGSAIGRSPPGAMVEISGVRHGEIVEISVRDIGEGISGETVHKILERFPSEQTSQSKGTSLYTAAKLARLFGGRLDIRSEDGKIGARHVLTMDLPLAGREEGSPHEEVARQCISSKELVRSVTSLPRHLSAKV